MSKLDFDASAVSVLIVDTAAFNRNLSAAVLRGAGLAMTHVAEDAEDARRHLRRHAPTVALLEWEDNGLDGLAFARDLRSGAMGVDRSLPLIMLTSKSSLTHVTSALAAGVNEYVVKPMSAHALLSRVREVALRPRQFVESPGYVGPCRRRRRYLDYAGPFRRMTDPVESEPNRPLSAGIKAAALARAEALLGVCQGFQAGDRGAVRELFSIAQSVGKLATNINDPALERLSMSMQRYLNGVGAGPNLDLRVVVNHAEAIKQLIAMPNSDAILRDNVAEGLERIVSRRLKRAAAATMQL